MSMFFSIHVNQELSHDMEQMFPMLNDLLQIFPKSQFLMAEAAMLHYHSEGLFPKVTYLIGYKLIVL